MASRNLDPKAVANEPLAADQGGNTAQPADGRDASGSLPAPIDAADYRAVPGSNPFADERQQASAGKPTGVTAKKAAARSGAKS